MQNKPQNYRNTYILYIIYVHTYAYIHIFVRAVAAE